MEILFLTQVLLWGVFVGVVFSAIGAAGGILTSFGLITLFGVVEPNTVKPMTQIVVLFSALTFVPGYLRHAAIVWPLGLLLGAGGLVGAYVGSTLSSLYLSDMSVFRPVFGLLTLAVSAQILFTVWKKTHTTSPDVRLADRQTEGVGETRLSAHTLTFRHGGESFRVPLWSPLLAGLLISLTASIFGVGGGFLLVPYMASVLGMPMHIIPATAAIAIFMSLAVSISNFIALGAPVDLGLLVPLVIGAGIGAILGPRINHATKNTRLQTAMALVVAVIGLKYTLF